jgi:hypothetical protein
MGPLYVILGGMPFYPGLSQTLATGLIYWLYGIFFLKEENQDGYGFLLKKKGLDVLFLKVLWEDNANIT